jgi:hypothetical protein
MASPQNMRFITPSDAHRLRIGCQGRDDRVSLTWESGLVSAVYRWYAAIRSRSERLLFCSIPNVPWWCPKPSSNHSAYLRVRGTRCRGRAPWQFIACCGRVIPRRRNDGGVVLARSMRVCRTTRSRITSRHGVMRPFGVERRYGFRRIRASRVPGGS